MSDSDSFEHDSEQQPLAMNVKLRFDTRSSREEVNFIFINKVCVYVSTRAGVYFDCFVVSVYV